MKIMNTFKAEVQVKDSNERYYPSKLKDHYFDTSIEQINDTLSLNPKKVLIIWWGHNLEKRYFEKKWIKVSTVDIDNVLQPDYLCSVTDLETLKFKDKEFDVIIASHILEHIPFKYMKKVLIEFQRISHYSNIYLPIAYIWCSITFKLWIWKELRLNINIPAFFWRKYKFNGEHYREIMTKWYSKKFMRKFFKKFFTIKKEYQSKFTHYSHNYILESKK